METQIQHNKPHSTSGLKTISHQQALKHKNNHQLFDKLWSEDQNLSLQQKIKMNVVSVEFLESWKAFCTSKFNHRYPPLQMNASLYDQTGKVRLNLKHKLDYQLLPSKVYKLLQQFHSNQLRGFQVLTKSQKEAKPTKMYSYFIITNGDLKYIDQKQKTRETLALKQIRQHEYKTVRQLGQKLLRVAGFPNQFQARLWKVNKNKGLNSLLQYLKTVTRHARYQYHINGFGQRTKPGEYLLDLQIDQGSYFVVQLKRPQELWYMYKQSQKNCPGCYYRFELEFRCKCQQVAQLFDRLQRKGQTVSLSNIQIEVVPTKKVKIQIASERQMAKKQIRYDNSKRKEVVSNKKQPQEQKIRKEQIFNQVKSQNYFYELLHKHQIRDEIIGILGRQEVSTVQQLRSCSETLLAAVGIPIGQILKLKKL